MRDSRGQLILVGAVAVAVVFVALALVFNTAIYTSTLATQQSGGDGSEPLAYQDAAIEGVGGIVHYANYYNHSGYGTLKRTTENQTRNWSHNATRHSVASRTATVTQVTTVTNGTQILQDKNQTFENAKGESKWKLAAGIKGTRRFAIQVERGTLNERDIVDSLFDTLDDTFYIRVKNGSATRYIFIYNDSTSDDIVVQVENSSTTLGRCTDDAGDPAVIDITQGRVDGEPCPSLQFPGVEPPYKITYNKSTSIEGRYSLVIDKETSGVPGSSYNSLPSEEPPYAVPAIYSATIEVTYESADLRYTTNRTVAPETPPQGPAFDVSPGPIPREIVYATPGDAWLHSITSAGVVTNYSVSGVEAIGPKDPAIDFDDDGYTDVPYVNSSSQLNVIDKNDAAPRHLADSAVASKTLLGVGTWNGHTGIFYVNSTDSSIYRASEGGTTTQVLAKDGDGDGISAVAGIAKYNDDPDTDLVFTDGSQMVTYVDGGTTHETGAGVGQNNGIAIGDPRNAYQNGTRYAPTVDGSNEGELLDYTGSRIFIGGSVTKTPVALSDWTGDSQLEFFYVDGSGQLYYFTLDGSSHQVTDTNGNAIGINTGSGVA